ncbi:iron(III) transport system permease protein [Aequitasia blattaphilus]|uniref:ABC transporter permease subunit n=1 Tax=Aequitasia blattaphilus TaxID=2949332 RepID=A0ABT1E7X9_9FIRM|nr:ABC transporter permease subunit [Aequitasia blattaphilus]MCP1101816.1 ABC transporter permease subunit [Aequitasia blattaphilus]MCR8614456.1 ABC transporter permease subunit [Aequitasia blattaphilus]
MKGLKEKESNLIWLIMAFAAGVFLFYPLGKLLLKSFETAGGIGIGLYQEVLAGKKFLLVAGNSVGIAGVSALLTTILAFVCAYSLHFSNLPGSFKKIIKNLCVLPMLLPTITYGFAIIYSFGKQGVYTRLLGRQLFDIYGINGLIIGYIIYTFPIAFLLLTNTMAYIDKKFVLVSRVMGDKGIKTFYVAVFRPLLGTIVTAIIQCFFLSFTDFGIPASVGGKVKTIAGLLYEQMLGSVPDFGRGAVIAIMMLLPSVISILLIWQLEKTNICYNSIENSEIPKGAIRDGILGIMTTLIVSGIMLVLLVIFLIPFISGWPYDLTFTLKHFKNVFADTALTGVLRNSLYVSLATALFGTTISFFAALVATRSKVGKGKKNFLDILGNVTNTIPGMVIGIAYMLTFTGTRLQTTFTIIIICNTLHFFATPYMMMKNSFLKLNSGFEATGKIMGDSWFQSLYRIIIPNTVETIFSVLNYYFVNSMVTISGIVFLTGARTMVMTTKIKELQHFAKFSEIFVLSFLIFLINLTIKVIFKGVKKYEKVI